jgi:DNA-binding FadR family transcriptional regulator
LHRLKLVGRRLVDAGYDRNTAADLAAARTALSPIALTQLLARLVDQQVARLCPGVCAEYATRSCDWRVTGECVIAAELVRREIDRRVGRIDGADGID